MAIRRNFNEEVTEEAPTKVVNDPDVNAYDKTDCYSQDVPVGDEKIAGTVDADLGDKEEKLEDDGIPTLEEAMMEDLIYEEMVQVLTEAKIKSKEDLEKQLNHLQGQPGALTKAFGWFKAIIGGAATTVGATYAAGTAAGAVAAATGSALLPMVPVIVIIWAMRKVMRFMMRQPGSIVAKTKEAKKVLKEVDAAIRRAEAKKVQCKTEEDKKKVEKYIEQLKAGREQAQKELDELIEAGQGKPEDDSNLLISKKTGKAYGDAVSKANIDRQTKKDEKKAAKAAAKAEKAAAKNESGIDIDSKFDAFIESVLAEAAGKCCCEDDHCEHDKTVDVADNGDGVNVTDTISGVIDDEKDDNEISTRTVDSPNFDGVSTEKTVCVNNESYKIRITATRI